MTNTNLYKKMHAVMSETKSLERDKEVGYGRNAYKAISESNVLNEIKPLFKKHGLIIFPISVDVVDRVDTFITKDGESSRLMTQVIPKWKIVDVESGESEVITSIGNGVDTQDKASGKAMTYALKVALQKTFMLFSGEDSDNDFSDDITKSQTRQPKQSHKPEPSGKADALAELAKMKGQDLGEIKTMIIKKYNKANISDLTDAEIEPIMKWLRGL